MILQEYITTHRPKLEQRILTYLTHKKATYHDKPLYAESIQKLIDTVTGGKLIRGILVLLAYESKANTISQDALTLAAAIELLHTGLLIHDDIMDNDALRRGKPTVFAQSISEGEQHEADNPREYGNAIAICVGDLAFFMAYELLGTINESPESRKLLYITAQELQKVGFAQITDVHYGINDFEPTEQEIIELYKFKTARYSFSLPLKLGGMLAGVDEKNIEKLELFGEELGIAFQIKDDELGILGTTSAIGKPVGSDIRENKKTLHRQMLFNAVDNKTKKRLREIYGNEILSESELHLIQEALHKYNIIADMQKIREAKSVLARGIIYTLVMPEKYKSIFSELVDFTNNRES